MNRWSLAAGAVVCAAYLTLAATSMWGSSATFDEGVNISSGYTYLTRGDFRLVPVHPPLMKMISALPLVSWGAACDYDSTGWRAAEPWSFAHQFLYVWNDGDSVLRLARAPTAAFALVLGLAVALWSRRHGGSALVALALCLFNPEVLAHGQLATNDLPVACCIFVAVAGFERLVSTATWPRWLLVAGAVGAAVTCKYTGLVLGPVIAVLGAVAILGPWPIDWRVRPGAHRLLATRAHKAAAVGLLLGGILAMVWAFIWLSYLLKARVSPNAEVAARVAARVGPAQGVLGQVALFAGQRRALPEAFTLGFVDTLRRSGGRPAFLHGRLSEEGWWHYYPVALGIKTPLGLQVLLVLAAVLAMRGRLPARWLAFTLPPGAIIAVFVLTSRVDLGLRLALPLYPFMIVAGALAAARLWERRLTRVLASILVAWAVGAAMRVHPHYLSYFNELIGGPTQGYRWLVDSSVDWGQDLKRLQTRIADLGAQEVKLSYFGSADPAYYKLPV